MNNTSRFKIYGILAAALIVVAGVVWFSHGKERSGKTSSTKKAVATEQTKRTSPKPAVATNSATKRPAHVSTTDAREGILHIRQNSGPYQGEVLQINAECKLNLNTEQLKDITIKYTSVALKRLQIEASYAKITKIGDNSYEVEIPAYEEGKKLRNLLVSEFNKLLGNGNESQLLASVESALDRENYNWGIAPQRIAMEYEPRSNTYKIRHTSYDYMSFDTGTDKVEMVGEGMRGSTVNALDFSNYYYLIKKIRDSENQT